jgi:hypothetical protein
MRIRTVTAAAAVAALSIGSFAGTAIAADTVTLTPDKVNATGDSVKVVWDGFAGATNVRNTIVQSQLSPFQALRDVTDSPVGYLTVTCDFTKPNGEVVKRAFNNTVSLDEGAFIKWGDNRRDACGVVDEVSLTVPVNDVDGDGVVTTTGKMSERDTFQAADKLAGVPLRVSVRADF